MSLEPFVDAAPVIQMHAAAATLALVLGPFVLWRQRRDQLHRVGGYVWVVSMTLAAGSAFFIHNFALIGPFSPIHLLAVLALGSLWFGMRAILRGNVRAHQRAFRNLYLRGVLVAGLFNLLPGRVVNRMVLPDSPDMGYILIAVGGALMLAHPVWTTMSRRRQRGSVSIGRTAPSTSANVSRSAMSMVTTADLAL